MQLNFGMVEKRRFECVYKGRGKVGKTGDQAWQKRYYLMNLGEVIWVFIVLFFDIFQYQNKTYFLF